jgi:Cu2+-exporting ATPase
MATVGFDKTGTLTKGSFEVTSVDSHHERYNQARILALAAALEGQSEHHIGTGIERPHGAGHAGGVTRVFVLVEGRPAGSVALSDAIRPESSKAIEALHKRGIKCWMLTGDGVNDSPELAQAQIGIAVGSGTDVAAATADIVLVNSNPLDITALILFGRATYRKMVQNLIWATGYNVVAIPLAAGVLYGAGIILSPEVGAILMSLSTVIVAINARLLRVKKEELEEATA